jgi:transcription antitermination protein NusB
VTDPRQPFLPPELALDDDDVVETEVVAETDETDAADAADGNAEDAPRVSGFDGIGTRRESRERALALLYEAEQKQIAPPAAILDTLPLPPETFAGELVVGVSDHLEELDAIISAYSHSWPIERMPAVDRALLRLGTFELTETDVPTGACISEAVELAKRYSTDDSHAFVNGMLARVAREHRAEG